MFNSDFFFPEQLIQRLAQDLAYRYAEVDGGVVITLFDRIDRLTGNAYLIGQFLLRSAARAALSLRFFILQRLLFVLDVLYENFNAY